MSSTNDSYIAGGGVGATDDLDLGGDSDYFLSFQIEMSALNAAYKAILLAE